jgi:hypothetical protein
VVVFLARDADKKEQPQEEHPILPKICPRTTAMLASRVVMLAIGIFVLFAALPLGSSATALPAYCGAPPVLAPPPLAMPIIIRKRSSPMHYINIYKYVVIRVLM